MRILVTGGTGFIGRPLVSRLLEAGHEARVLSRDPAAAEKRLPPAARAFAWRAPEPLPPEALAGVDAVLHCAGENVGRWPWTRERKRDIRESRVEATRRLVQSLAEAPRRPKALIAASAVGYYGDSGDNWLREGDGPGKGFLAQVVKDWEAELFKAEALGIRTVALRLGVVLGRGGALDRMLPPFKAGLGAVVGSGMQYLSWVHIADAVEAFVFALGKETARGPLNLGAPEPATHRDFSRSLARALRRPLLLRAPGWAVQLALGEMGRETLLKGQRVSSEKLASLGYAFRFPALDLALGDILGPSPKRS